MSEQELIEALAAKEHESWARSRWMEYVFSVCDLEADGTFTVSASLASRWLQQCATPYAQLSQREKQADRDEVAHILPIIKAYAEQRPHEANDG